MSNHNKFMVKWANIRNRGRLFYIFFFWVLPVTIIFPIVFLLMATYFKFGNDYFRNSSPMFKIIVGLIAAPFIGYSTGSANWIKNENKYEDVIRERSKIKH